jgi:protein TonB
LQAPRGDPVLIQRIEPSYPEAARQRRIQGWVEIEIDVGADGSVAAARIVDASPSAIFNAAALRAVSRWRFDPAQAGGEAQPVTTRTRINFRLG